MQNAGIPVRVKLNCDLIKYDKRLVKGSEGETIPEHKCSSWGTFDNFVAVKFDCGAIMDIAINSLDYDKNK